MYLYLAGAMRGIADLNHPQFHVYASLLRANGYRVLSPADSPPPNSGPNPGRADCLRHDLLIVGVVEGVAVLPNWDDSPGARLEVAAAWGFDIPVYEADVLLHPDLNVEFLSNPREHLRPYELSKGGVVIPRERQYYEKRPLVGLSGYAGAGKDAIAAVMTQHLGWTRIAFADPLKDVARAMGWNGEKDEVGRKLLQDLGVGVREHLNPEAWVQAAEERIESVDGPVVITDVRFPNELKMIRRRGGTVVRVVRPNTGAVNAHVSEHLVTDEDCDEIFNNNGTLDDLAATVPAFFAPRTQLLAA